MEIEVWDEKWPKVLFDNTEPRKEGLHLSAVIKSLQDRMNLRYKGKGFEDMNLTAEIGLLWELELSKIMRDKYAIRPLQMQVDGIWMSPDGLGIETDPKGIEPLVLEEYKLTWKSTKHSPTDNFAYMAQVKAYCHAMNLKVCIMRIFHVMGDYKGSGPIYRVTRVVFTQRELDKNWEMILREKDRMEMENE